MYLDNVENWVRTNFKKSDSFGRTAVYNVWLYGKEPNFTSTEPGQVSRRPFKEGHRFGIPLKLMADLAYKANIPFQTGRVFISPEGYPDADSLPLPIFRRADDNIYAKGAELEAYFELLQQLATASRAFQQAFLVPDWASVSLVDVAKLRLWQSWRDLSCAQHDLYDNQKLEQISSKAENYFDALRGFHQDVSDNFHSRGWRSLFPGPVNLVAQVAVFINEQPLTSSALELLLHHEIEDMPSTAIAKDSITCGVEMLHWYAESISNVEKHHLDLRQRFLMRSGALTEQALQRALRVQTKLPVPDQLDVLERQPAPKATDASG